MPNQENLQASYSIIRYIPSILREEFVNVGVILVCPEVRYQAVQALPDAKLRMFDIVDGRFVQDAITKLRLAAERNRFDEFVSAEAAPEGALTTAGLAKLSASYHNNIRLTKPRTLLTTNPEASLRALHDMFIGSGRKFQELRERNNG